MLLHFTKMEGCGNDYVYVDGAAEKEVLSQLTQAEKEEMIRKLSDRHFGIGGDGVIFINPSDVADFEMEMYNADGSRGEMCGNGIRCVGKYVYDHGMTGGRKNFTVESFKVPRYLTVTETDEDGRAEILRVNMGAPILEPAKIPADPNKNAMQPAETLSGEIPAETAGKAEDILIRYPLYVEKTKDLPALNEFSKEDGKDGIWHVTCVSMGNPHAVVFIDNTEALPIEQIGPGFEYHPMFPNRTNTEFVEVVDRSYVKMRVWERGSGETLACGTGCCATGVACILNSLTEDKLTVEVLGGKIGIEWDRAENMLYMTGPARTVFKGTVDI